MRLIYNFLITLVQWMLPISTLFGPKMKQFVRGRKGVFTQLAQALDGERPTIWFHAASLGEYEQGLPVIKAIHQMYPDHQMLLSFFSPSGYEHKKDSAFKSMPSLSKGVVCYLPLDTRANAISFLDVVNPVMVFFIKYEFWPNYLRQLKKRKTRTFLLSGVFRPQQAFFKWHGKWMRKSLRSFEHFFLQDTASLEHLHKLHFQNATLSGDTRFDRVAQQIEQDNTLAIAEGFVKEQHCVVCGSTWPEDLAVLVPFINTDTSNTKWVIAPHELHPDKLAQLKNDLQVSYTTFSEGDSSTLAGAKVLILDTIGLLSRMYSYAHIAYVGGAAGHSGLHNILEPATFGIPILCGPHIEKFPEAQRLRQLAGLYTVANKEEATAMFKKLLADTTFRTQTGMIAGHFVNANTGATKTVISYIKQYPL